MIDIKTKIHDRLSIEFKVGFVTSRKLKINDFNLAMWIFVPDSLDINHSTYSKSDFYRDVKSNVRLITPHILLRDIASGEAEPLRKLEKAAEQLSSHPSRVNVAEFEYQAKIFSTIIKSALRDESQHIASISNRQDFVKVCNLYRESIQTVFDGLEVVRGWLAAPIVPAQQRQCFDYCCEFVCNVTAQYTLKLLKHSQSLSFFEEDGLQQLLGGIANGITEYSRLHNYVLLSETDTDANSHYVYRQSLIKKFIERQLYLKVPKKRDGLLAEQAYYSVAAGIAMIFATVIGWAFQRTFGNLTWPLFIALIISYMLKDRIKDLMRYYFSHKIGGRYFDNKAEMSHKGTRIGWMKEAMDFVPVNDVPDEVMELRHDKPLSKIEPRVSNDRIILYRKSVHIDRDELEAGSNYEFSGINDIIRLQVSSFLRMMDDAQCPMNMVNSEGVAVTTMSEKLYYLCIILQYENADEMDFKHLRICLTRDGIKHIEEL